MTATNPQQVRLEAEADVAAEVDRLVDEPVEQLLAAGPSIADILDGPPEEMVRRLAARSSLQRIAGGSARMRARIRELDPDGSLQHEAKTGVTAHVTQLADVPSEQLLAELES